MSPSGSSTPLEHRDEPGSTQLKTPAGPPDMGRADGRLVMLQLHFFRDPRKTRSTPSSKMIWRALIASPALIFE